MHVPLLTSSIRVGEPGRALWGGKIRFLLQTAPFSLSIPSFGTPHAECGDVQRPLACAPAGTSRSGTPLRGERLLAWTPQLRSCSFYSSSSCPPLLSVVCSSGQRSRTGKRTGRCRRGSVSGAGQGSDASPIAPWGVHSADCTQQPLSDLVGAQWGVKTRVGVAGNSVAGNSDLQAERDFGTPQAPRGADRTEIRRPRRGRPRRRRPQPPTSSPRSGRGRASGGRQW